MTNGHIIGLCKLLLNKNVDLTEFEWLKEAKEVGFRNDDLLISIYNDEKMKMKLADRQANIMSKTNA